MRIYKHNPLYINTIKSFESEDIADEIEWLLNASNYDELCVNTREKVVKDFDSEAVAWKYIELYREVLNDK